MNEATFKTLMEKYNENGEMFLYTEHMFHQGISIVVII
jgi:hypothetical protein